jgi:hypothetical protein
MNSEAKSINKPWADKKKLVDVPPTLSFLSAVNGKVPRKETLDGPTQTVLREPGEEDTDD